MNTPIPITAARPRRPETIEGKNATARYKNAYLQAHWLMQAGHLIQTVGWTVGAFIFCGALFAAHTVLTPLTPAADWLPPAGLAIGAIISAFLFWLVGELLCVRGEDFEATLDAAVNSSPFLSDEQRAIVMGLS
jgi:hypothetical protein